MKKTPPGWVQERRVGRSGQLSGGVFLALRKPARVCILCAKRVQIG